jgi:hypothetical protein
VRMRRHIKSKDFKGSVFVELKDVEEAQRVAGGGSLRCSSSGSCSSNTGSSSASSDVVAAAFGLLWQRRSS